MRGLGYLLIAAYWGLQASALACGAASGVLGPRVPYHELAAARALTNPLPATPAVVEKGRALYHGKGFCVACHGLEGRGITDVDTNMLKGALPTDFTKMEWQAARTDGELMWVLKNGSPGTAMASFVPVILTEKDAWQVIRYLRSFGRP
jgi:mono/diheme cytochrome c family protein